MTTHNKTRHQLRRPKAKLTIRCHREAFQITIRYMAHQQEPNNGNHRTDVIHAQYQEVKRDTNRSHETCRQTTTRSHQQERKSQREATKHRNNAFHNPNLTPSHDADLDIKLENVSPKHGGSLQISTSHEYWAVNLPKSSHTHMT